jgi:hypothetical protein
MIEVRKKLTDIQFRLLVNAQMKYDDAVAVGRAAATELNTVRELVMDAHEMNSVVTSFIDAATQELVFELEEEESEPETD